MRRFLEVVARETGATSVSIIAHSMGNQLLLPVLRDLKRAAPPSVKISQVILAAPDVDCDANIAREVMGVSRGLLIQTGERPRDKRAPILERVKTDRGDYWRYPKLGR